MLLLLPLLSLAGSDTGSSLGASRNKARYELIESLVDFSPFEEAPELALLEQRFGQWFGKSTNLLNKLRDRVNWNRLLKKLEEERRAHAEEAARVHGGLLLNELTGYLEACLCASRAPEKHMCREKTFATNYNNFFALFASQINREGPLFRLLRSGLLALLEYCKPHWDEELLEELVELRMEAPVRKKMDEMFDVLMMNNELLKPGRHLNDHAWHNDERLKLTKLNLFERLAKQQPKPSSMLLYLLLYHEREFDLDENMRNPELEVSTCQAAVKRLVWPVCERVHQLLGPTTDFYMEVLYGNKLLNRHDVNLRLFLDNFSESGTRNRVHKWLLSDLYCRRLLDPCEGASIFKQMYRDITKGTGARKRPINNSDDECDAGRVKEEAETGPDSGVIKAALASVDAWDRELKRQEREFEERRHKSAMRQAGFRPNKKAKQKA